MRLLVGSAPGGDIRVSEQRLAGGRNFANKLWNASRFIFRSIEAGRNDLSPVPHSPQLVEDRWILSRLNRVSSEVNQLLDDFQLGEAEKRIHDFIWGEFCDWYIELAKIRLQQHAVPSPLPILVEVLRTSLCLLHPFMPFITVEIWQIIIPFVTHDESRAVIVAPYPESDESVVD